MTSPLAPSRTIRIGIIAASIVLALDAVTKFWAVSSLADDRKIHLFWTLRLALVHNEGMAFSTGTNVGPFIGMLAIFVIGMLFLTLRKSSNIYSLIATGSIIGGATGNVLDRVFRGEGFMGGAVVDFIDFQWWPVFNVADIGIVCGAMVIAYIMLTTKPEVLEGTE